MLNPVSLAASGVPNFSATGNLWNWLGQLRLTQEIGTTTAGQHTSRVERAGRVDRPYADAQAPGEPDAVDAGERSGRPALEARIRAEWGDSVASRRHRCVDRRWRRRDRRSACTAAGSPWARWSRDEPCDGDGRARVARAAARAARRGVRGTPAARAGRRRHRAGVRPAARPRTARPAHSRQGGVGAAQCAAASLRCSPAPAAAWTSSTTKTGRPAAQHGVRRHLLWRPVRADRSSGSSTAALPPLRRGHDRSSAATSTWRSALSSDTADSTWRGAHARGERRADRVRGVGARAGGRERSARARRAAGRGAERPAQAVVYLEARGRGLPAAAAEPELRAATIAMTGREFVPHVRVCSPVARVDVPEPGSVQPQRVLQRGSGTVRPRPVPARREPRGDFPRAGRLSDLLQHPLAHGELRHRRADRHSSPWSAADGRFTIPDVPPGTYRLHAWHERAGARVVRDIVVPRERACRPARRARRAHVRAGSAPEQVRPSVRGDARGPVLMLRSTASRASAIAGDCRARVFLGGAAALVLVLLALVFVMLSRWAQRSGEAVVQRELEQSADLARAVPLRRQRSLAGGARVFVQGPYFRSFVPSSGATTSSTRRSRRQEQLDADWVFIVDERGIAARQERRARRRRGRPWAAFRSSRARCRDASRAASASRATRCSSRRSRYRSSCRAGAPIGALVATKVVDSLLARDVKAATSADIVFFVRDTAGPRIAASTFGGSLRGKLASEVTDQRRSRAVIDGVRYAHAGRRADDGRRRDHRRIRRDERARRGECGDRGSSASASRCGSAGAVAFRAGCARRRAPRGATDAPSHVRRAPCRRGRVPRRPARLSERPREARRGRCVGRGASSTRCRPSRSPGTGQRDQRVGAADGAHDGTRGCRRPRPRSRCGACRVERRASPARFRACRVRRATTGPLASQPSATSSRTATASTECSEAARWA